MLSSLFITVVAVDVFGCMTGLLICWTHWFGWPWLVQFLVDFQSFLVVPIISDNSNIVTVVYGNSQGKGLHV